MHHGHPSGKAGYPGFGKFPGIQNLHRLNRSKLKETEASVTCLGEPKPLDMGLQASHSLAARTQGNQLVLRS